MRDNSFPVQVASTHGHVPHDLLPRAEDMVRDVARHAPAPVLFARVSLEHDEDPAVARSVIARATLDVNGHPVRAQIAAEHFDEALDLLQARLRRGLDILAERRLQRRTGSGGSEPGEWRHGDLSPARPAHFPRPSSEREVVRRKSYALRTESVDEAALDLELLDHDWVLFTELGTGQDAVLVRTTPGYRLDVAGGSSVDIAAATIPVRPGRHAPTLPLTGAIEALEVSREPFVFFVDDDSGESTVAYWRDDGNYGVVVPSAAATGATVGDRSPAVAGAR